MNYPVLVIDANKILAAILRPGKVRTLLFTARAVIITPVHAWEEAGGEITELAKKKGIDQRGLEMQLDEIRREVIIEDIPREPYITQSKETSFKFDPDDWPFIALALDHRAPIWTNNRDLIRYSLRGKKYRAVDTRGVEMLLEGKPWKEIEEYLKRKYR